MAKPQFSGIAITDLRRSINNTTFSRNRYGTYSKRKIGAPASTPFLVSWQTIVGTVQGAWSFTLTEDQRRRWVATKRKSKNDLGESIYISGFDLFMYVNLNRSVIGSGIVVTPPKLSYPERLKSFSTITTVTPTLLVYGNADSLFEYALYVTKPLPIGRMSSNQIYTLLGHRITNVYHDIYPFYVARMGVAPSSGSKVFIRGVAIDPVSGVRGVAVFESVIIA